MESAKLGEAEEETGLRTLTCVEMLRKKPVSELSRAWKCCGRNRPQNSHVRGKAEEETGLRTLICAESLIFAEVLGAQMLLSAFGAVLRHFYEIAKGERGMNPLSPFGAGNRD